MSGSNKVLLKGEHTGFSYSWVTLPPVRELTNGAQVRQAVLEMGRNFEDWIKNPELDDGEGKLPESSEAPHAEAWNDRNDATRTMLESIGDGQNLNLAYYCFGIPVGLMVIITKTTEYYIADVLTHPGVANAAEILFEEACTRADKAGCHGKLKLFSLNDNATGFYRSIGFVTQCGDTMTLDPGSTERWAKLNDRWYLKRYEGKSYMFGPPPVPGKPKKK